MDAKHERMGNARVKPPGSVVAQGRAWKFGDNINTDEIIPARYLNVSDPEVLAQHCMEDADPSFAGKVAASEIIVAGK